MTINYDINAVKLAFSKAKAGQKLNQKDIEAIVNYAKAKKALDNLENALQPIIATVIEIMPVLINYIIEIIPILVAEAEKE